MRYKVYYNIKNGFTLIEVMTALIILALISFNVLVVVDNCVVSAANSKLRMQAFQVARENMEQLLAAESLSEKYEYGTSDKYPDIEWKTVVEAFYEPVTARMWIRGVCSAGYEDTDGEEQEVELTHWLTDLTKEQLLEMMNEEGMEQLAGELFETLEEAADYAGVSVDTIEQWLENGLVTTEDGSFIKGNLDIFMEGNGNPSQEDKDKQIQSESELMDLISGRSGEQGGEGGEGWQNEIDPKTGLTYGELENMDFSEIWEIMKNR